MGINLSETNLNMVETNKVPLNKDSLVPGQLFNKTDELR